MPRDLTRWREIACPDYDPERNNMKKPHLYFRAYLAALLMLAVVPAEAADVKELFAIDLADYQGKEGRMLEVSYRRGDGDMVHGNEAMRSSTCSKARSSCR